MIITAQCRRGPAKTLEAARRARARKDVRQALASLLRGLEPHAVERVTDALFDVASELHAHVHGPDVTATRHSATSGRLYPYTSRKPALAEAEAEAEAVFAKTEAA